MSGEGTAWNEIDRVRVGKSKKWTTLHGWIDDPTTGVDLILLADGTVRWEQPEGES